MRADVPLAGETPSSPSPPPCPESLGPNVLNRKRSYAICEIHRRPRVPVSMKMRQESGGKDITGTGGVHLVRGIGGETLGDTMLEECRPVPAIGGDQQGDLHAPTGQDCVGIRTIAGGEWEQVIVAENEHIEERQHFFSDSPGSGPHAPIIVPAAQPTLRRGCDERPWASWKVTYQFR